MKPLCHQNLPVADGSMTRVDRLRLKPTGISKNSLKFGMYANRFS